MSENANNDFRFPFSSFAGSRLVNFLAMSVRNRISWRKSGRFILSLVICIILEPFRWIERIIDHRRIKRTQLKEEPWFVIGFWRGGTTLMHELLTADKRFFYVTTYQTIFPELMHYRPVLKWLTKFFMPDYRPVDKMKLSLDRPQEEEIALANYNRASFYHFLYFPLDYPAIKRKSLELREQGGKKTASWLQTYHSMIIKASWNKEADTFLSKNPANTYRIKELLQKYPEARFIYLYRDPNRVLSSFYLFMNQVIDGIGFQVIEREKFIGFMSDLFSWMLERYEEDRKMIPAKNLIEVRFEDFVKDPKGYLEDIYRNFDSHMDPAMERNVELILERYKNHRSGRYDIDPEIRELILQRFGHWMKEKGYA